MAQWFGGWPARLGASHIHTSTPLTFQLVNSVEVSNDSRDGRGINLPPMQTGRRRQTKLFWEHSWELWKYFRRLLEPFGDFLWRYTLLQTLISEVEFSENEKRICVSF